MDYIARLAVLLLIVFVNCAQSTKLDTEQAIIKSILNEYASHIRPPGENGTGPVKVEVNTYIRSINNIDDVQMAYDVQLTFRQSWKDSRLRYSNRELPYVSLQDVERVWHPDLFFSNEEEGHFHNIIRPNVLMRIFPDGTVLYSVRVSLRLLCPMNLRSYPMDNQVCPIRMASYAYTTEDIVFYWKKSDPIQVTKHIHLPKFTMDKFQTDYCTSRTNTGEYSCLQVDLFFSRDIFYYLERTYMPTAALVLLSWLIFWMNPKFSNVRLGIWIGCMISMIMVMSRSMANDPQVSYTKAIDVWTGVCLSFIFCVLIEICLVCNSISHDNENATDAIIDQAVGEKNAKSLTSHTSTPLKWLNRYSTRAQRIDAVARVLFPAAFIFFNFIYWITYKA